MHPIISLIRAHTLFQLKKASVALSFLAFPARYKHLLREAGHKGMPPLTGERTLAAVWVFNTV